MQWRPYAALAAVLLAGVIGYAIDRGEEPRALADPTPPDLDALKDELRRYRSEVLAVRALAKQAQIEADRSERETLALDGESIRAASESESKASDDSRPQPRREHQDYMAQLEESFLAEDQDASWQPQRELTRKLTEILPRGSAVRDVECRTSMCRLVTTHSDTLSYRSFTQAFSSFAPATTARTPVWDGWIGFEVPQEPARQGDMVIAKVFLGRPTQPHFE